MNVGDLLGSAVHHYPDRTALIEPGRTGLLIRTFKEIENNAARLASALTNSGLRRGDTVAIIMRNQLEYFECFLGVAKAGLVAVPISIHAGSARTALALADCMPQAVIADGYGSIFEKLPLSNVAMKIIVHGKEPGWADYFELLDQAPLGFPTVAVDPNSIAYCLYTSGSSGHPKGVLISHRAALHVANGGYLIPSQRALIAMPITHEAAFATIRQTLAIAGSIVLLDKFTPKVFLSLLSRLQCTRTVIVPSMALALIPELEALEDLPFSSLQLVAIGGAPVDRGLLRYLQRAFSNSRVTQFYAMTETGNVFTYRHQNGKAPPLDSVGVPANGVLVKLCNGNEDNRGELHVRTPTLMQRYKSGLSGDIAEPWVATGDIFFRDEDGFYYFLGRADDMFLCGGENVYPLELERILVSHPAVSQAVVCPQEDFTLGNVPIAFIVKKDGFILTEGDLISHYDEVGPAFARPSKIIFLENIPLTRNGKIDRTNLRERLTQSL